MNENSCAYLPGKKMRMKSRQVEDVSKTFSTAVAQRGWRRFGKNFVYPDCIDCTECKSMRINVENYKYSKSQRKTINKNEATKIVIQEPNISQERIDLYNKYHRYKAKKRWLETSRHHRTRVL
ncbi:MAG: hypothetical protein Q9M39_03945 [Sulfurovum sp.]|nr:hypothetical protein [Sulfurovum sp.]